MYINGSDIIYDVSGCGCCKLALTLLSFSILLAIPETFCRGSEKWKSPHCFARKRVFLHLFVLHIISLCIGKFAHAIHTIILLVWLICLFLVRNCTQQLISKYTQNGICICVGGVPDAVPKRLFRIPQILQMPFISVTNHIQGYYNIIRSNNSKMVGQKWGWKIGKQQDERHRHSTLFYWSEWLRIFAGACQTKLLDVHIFYSMTSWG